MWCGLPITGDSLGGDFEITKIEIEYLGGIDRLDDPAPVKLAVGPAGVDISEIIPGSRNVRIAADQIIDAKVEDASSIIERKRKRAPLWWYLIRPLGSAPRGETTTETKKHDYILTIVYRAEGEVRKAAFRREDSLGLALLNGIARIIALLVRRNDRQKL
ncbi:MAG TPA: hypothetical protein VKA70_02890 [Blastocatellia bacterium]|nr:hypothetical protein [Blastocatellia bacterium]